MAAIIKHIMMTVLDTLIGAITFTMVAAMIKTMAGLDMVMQATADMACIILYQFAVTAPATMLWLLIPTLWPTPTSTRTCFQELQLETMNNQATSAALRL